MLLDILKMSQSIRLRFQELKDCYKEISLVMRSDERRDKLVPVYEGKPIFLVGPQCKVHKYVYDPEENIGLLKIKFESEEFLEFINTDFRKRMGRLVSKESKQIFGKKVEQDVIIGKTETPFDKDYNVAKFVLINDESEKELNIGIFDSSSKVRAKGISAAKFGTVVPEGIDVIPIFHLVYLKVERTIRLRVDLAQIYLDTSKLVAQRKKVSIAPEAQQQAQVVSPPSSGPLEKSEAKPASKSDVKSA
jgi:hypothetical protein